MKQCGTRSTGRGPDPRTTTNGLAVMMTVGWIGLATSLSTAPAQADYAFGAIAGEQVPVRRDSAPDLPLGFYVYLPPDYDPTARYPLLIWLHGSGEVGNGNSDLPKVIGTGLPALIEQHIDQYVPPEYTSVFAPGGVPFPVVDSIVVSPQGSWGNSTANDARFEALLGRLVSEFAVDEDRVYLTGWSYGAGGVLRYARLFSGRFAAIAPFSGGGGNPANSVLDGLPIWAHVSSYEKPAGGTTFKQQAFGISQSRTPFLDMTKTYPWPISGDGTVMPSEAVKPAMALWRESRSMWLWDPTGALNDYTTDSDVTAIFSVHLAGSHAHAWQRAFRAQAFWTWLYAQQRDAPTTPRLLIDLGAGFNQTPDANNVTGDGSYVLHDAAGKDTSISLLASGFASSKVTGGTTMPSPALAIPPTASSDALIADLSSAGPHITLTGLTTMQRYVARIFASGPNSARTGTTRYVVSGATTNIVELDAKLNTDSIAQVELAPSATGTLTITLARASTSTPTQDLTIGVLTLE